MWQKTLTWKWSVLKTLNITNHHEWRGDVYLPKNLNGAPQIENKEHNWLVVHFLQTSKNNEEDKIPSNHLVENETPKKQIKIN